MTEDLTITIASDDEHEKVFAEIYCKGKFVALVSQDEGTHRMRIEFPRAGLDETKIERAVDVEWFRRALIAATTKLNAKAS